MFVKPIRTTPPVAIAAATANALIVATIVGLPRRKDSAQGSPVPQPPARPNAFVKIAPDNTVTVMIGRRPIGHDDKTGLACVVADELDADWSQIRTDIAPSHLEPHGHHMSGAILGTGGSTAGADSTVQLRKAGAAAKEMLIAAAAFDWKVPAGEITVARGVLLHAPSGRSATFGEFASSASTLPVPQEPRLKDSKERRAIDLVALRRV
jgi:isoquinoline 1-oxidoreductase subunit beta